ncbi:hypothetical protein [Robinsoniella sp. KNHs210]|uniref:hypothetical protein n=1 Tax=Robinsoniella TaxID=588605 RepID=UPI00047F4993|nr:hypothetical protein [Robinsoniella sp. KNHs210]
MSEQIQNDIEAKINRLRELEVKQQLEIKKKVYRKRGIIGIGIILMLVLLLFVSVQFTYIAGQYYTLKRQINIMDERIQQLASDMRMQEGRIEERNTNKDGEK